MGRKVFGVGVGIGLLVLLYLLGPILTPFVISAALAYLGDPVVDLLERRGISRTWAVACVFLAFSLALSVALLLVIPSLQDQIAQLIKNLPRYLEWTYDKLRALLAPFVRLSAEPDVGQLKEITGTELPQAGGMVKKALGALAQPGLGLLALIGNIVLVPVVTFYLLRDWDKLIVAIGKLIPRRALPTATQLARESDEVLSAFMRGQLIVMLALATYYSVALGVVGLEAALLIGIIAGLITFVPYLGFIVGLLSAGIAIVAQTHELLPLAWVVLVFVLGQVLEDMILKPLLVGDRIGLHPVAVIFAVLAGGQLFGFVGVLLAIPAAAVIAVMLRQVLSNWLDSET